MTEDAIPTRYWGCALEELPEDLQDKVREDPELLAAFQAQRQVAQLMRLKRYETPDPALSGRLSHRVGIRIQNLPQPKTRSLRHHWVVPEWARMVAVVAVMLGLSVLVHREMVINETEEITELNPHVSIPEELPRLDGSRREPIPSLAGDSSGTAPATVRFSDLEHQDAFTTRLPGFQLNFEPFPVQGNGALSGGTQTAVSTNQWSSPLLMPVSNPNP